MTRRPPTHRTDYRFFRSMATRWLDNDVYGHVNNVHYYSFFDTVIAYYLMEVGGLRPLRDDVVGLAVETGCRFHRSLAFPDVIEAGLAVGHLGRSSVRYEIGIFCNDEPEACADGHFVHVFVTRTTQRPTPIPEVIRTALAALRRG